MSKKSKIKIQSLEDLSPETKELFKILNKASDIACVLIGTSYLDECLASILKRYFIEDNNTSDRILNPLENGCLATFKSRIDMVYLLGLINEFMYKDLKNIAKIRNLFAHSYLKMNFENDAIQELCNKLDYVNKIVSGDNEALPHFSDLNSRSKFTSTVAHISSQLLVSGLSIEHKKKNTDFVKHLYERD